MKKIDINQLEFKEVSTKSAYYSIIESLLFVSGEPLKIKDIAAIMECSVEFTKEVIKELAFSYEEDSRGLKLIIINDECQLITKPGNSQYIQKLLNVNVRQSLSQASLETLAIIAYKQPMTRIGIDEIRGLKRR
jgi:segregation and condensation protein B